MSSYVSVSRSLLTKYFLLSVKLVLPPASAALNGLLGACKWVNEWMKCRRLKAWCWLPSWIQDLRYEGGVGAVGGGSGGGLSFFVACWVQKKPLVASLSRGSTADTQGFPTGLSPLRWASCVSLTFWLPSVIQSWTWAVFSLLNIITPSLCVNGKVEHIMHLADIEYYKFQKIVFLHKYQLIPVS